MIIGVFDLSCDCLVCSRAARLHARQLIGFGFDTARLCSQLWMCHGTKVRAMTMFLHGAAGLIPVAAFQSNEAKAYARIMRDLGESSYYLVYFVP